MAGGDTRSQGLLRWRGLSLNPSLEGRAEAEAGILQHQFTGNWGDLAAGMFREQPFAQHAPCRGGHGHGSPAGDLRGGKGTAINGRSEDAAMKAIAAVRVGAEAEWDGRHAHGGYCPPLPALATSWPSR